MHRHRVVSKINGGELKLFKVLFVFRCVLEVVPVHPKIPQLGQVIDVLELRNLVHGKIKECEL